jgi:hypothetical protein
MSTNATAPTVCPSLYLHNHQAKTTRANILLRASKAHGLKVGASSACCNKQRATAPQQPCRGLATVLVTGGLDFRGQKGMLESSDRNRAKKLKLKTPTHTHTPTSPSSRWPSTRDGIKVVRTSTCQLPSSSRRPFARVRCRCLVRSSFTAFR